MLKLVDGIEQGRSVTLFHGTTRSAAARIVREGWEQRPALVIIEQVAAEWDVDVSTLGENIRDYAGFGLFSGRGATVSFDTDPIATAHSWAQRSPETRWEALWAVWRLRNPRLAETWTTEAQGRAWVHQQMSNDFAAMITWTTTYGELVALGARRGGFGRSSGLAAVWEGGSMEIEVSAPFRPEPGAIETEHVDRIVDAQLLSYLLGVDVRDLADLRESGQLPAPDSEAFELRVGERRPWWWTSSVEPLLQEASGGREVH
ncbi:MAG TPA: hypothetical protein VG899_15775 [Mycobacteriales bacterium]|nr:hypothetical protein [Mycobacteriales bacterium]